MKRILRSIIFSSLALYFASLLLPGLQIRGGLTTYIVAGLVLSLSEFILKPVFTIITFPLTLLTFGLFSWIINTLIFYLVSILYRPVYVSSFIFDGIYYKGFTIPRFTVSLILSYFIISVTIYVVKRVAFWLSENS